ncbi:uncharacterized protein N0V89_005268 [Didymosphaeria variabile]|uniref:Uncharacterized protein n=1 Tax=Didymosphaeria variabile TaxID=1932322 RepID=A0A9W8XMK1_9PLEO|nr:uncharacterized protein N0V89_005268 [Didymosphaeria variabile]KAJ4353538.1 hypothetical protein N0V89_005268 [Didymosphaeria variabile]
MSYQQRSAAELRGHSDSAGRRAKSVDELFEDVDHDGEMYTGEGAEITDDDDPHHHSPSKKHAPGVTPICLQLLIRQLDQALSPPHIPRSESPLFEPESEDDPLLDAAMASLSEAGRSSPLPYTATLDGLKRARDIKHQIEKNLNILGRKSMRVRTRTVEEDPDNQTIKTMRAEHHMSWQAIVTHLNNERLKRGEPQTWTSAAVYSRFVRNAPRIAAAQGEIGFSPQDYMHLRKPESHPAAQLPGALNKPSGYKFGAGGGRKRVRDTEHAAQDLADNLRHKCADTLSEQAKMLEHSDMTGLMMEAVATVEQEFWGTVANALEKKTGKYFDPKVLESRYHSVKW